MVDIFRLNLEEVECKNLCLCYVWSLIGWLFDVVCCNRGDSCVLDVFVLFVGFEGEFVMVCGVGDWRIVEFGFGIEDLSMFYCC